MASLVPTRWSVNGNGFKSTLTINSVDSANGQVTGEISDSNGTLQLQNARWEEDARRLTFTRTLPNGERQTFTGFLFDSSGNPAQAFALAGTFVADRFEDPRRPAFGWFALGDLIIM